MKKWLLILAVGLTAASCQWWHETFNDPEECVVWYLDKLAETKDLDEFEELYNDYTIWYEDLGYIDQIKCEKAAREWREDHEDEWEDIDERNDKLYEKYRYEPK
jgi:hypothetical protein